MKAAKLYISTELMFKELHIPVCTILSAKMINWYTLELTLESHEFPELKEGEEPPLLNPTITYTFDWGVEK